MGGLDSFFVDASVSGPYLQGQYNLGLVLLSLLVSIFSATMALQTAQIARGNENPLYRHVAIGTGAVALGIGIWTMHFIGMLAFELPAHVHYSTTITLLSVLPACAASWFALRILASPETTWSQLIMSGTLVGLGIGTMHYSGMAAMHTPLQMRYEPVTFAASITVAVGLAIVSLWVRYGLRRTSLSPTKRLLASGHVMGLAIAGMHYTGMAATRFIGDPGSEAPGMLLDTSLASITLSVFTVMATVLVYAVNGLVRSRELYRTLEESQSRLRATLDTAVDGIVTFDGQGLIRSFNNSAEGLFGWQAHEVIGRSLKMLMPESDQLHQDDAIRRYLASTTPSGAGMVREVISRRKDNTLMPTRLAIGRVDLSGERLFVGFVADISERHAMEISLRESAERAERATAAKSTFLANMSHEMRTPMNSVIGFTELMLQGNVTATQRNHLNAIRQSSRALLGLINDILDTTRMEKGNLPLQCVDFSLKELARQIESSLRLPAQAKQLTLATHYPETMPEYFQGDPLRVLQIVTNLVGNAIKFTERGSVAIHFAHDDCGVHITVRDSGIGMSAQQLKLIFTPFTQGDASISRRFGGTGLGTTIARQLAELMGGDIDVESEPGHGSTFRIWLPLPVGQQPTTLRHDATVPPLLDEITPSPNLQLSPTEDDDGVRSTDTATLIDWPAGIALWGSEARMRRGLELFLATTQSSHPLPEASSDTIDWSQLIFNLHNIRGVTANLALPRVTALAGRLEEQLRAGMRDSPYNDVRPQLAELQRLLVAVDRELRSGAMRSATLPAEAISTSPASPELLTRMRKLLVLLTHNELDDTTLDDVCLELEREGERTQAYVLRTAVERFEFAEAHALLQQLIDNRAGETGDTWHAANE